MSIHGQVLRSNVDMTQGRPLNVIFSFALPLLMGNLFNQLYNVVDTAIVGRALGADALAAVGSTGNINACLFLLLAGLATGVSVIVSQYWGAERYDELRRLLGTFLTLLLAASVVMSLLGGPAGVCLFAGAAPGCVGHLACHPVKLGFRLYHPGGAVLQQRMDEANADLNR